MVIGLGNRVCWTCCGFAAAIALGCATPVDQQVAVSENELAVCPAGATVEGIDVSVYQGSIDWNQVKASGIEFAVTRISDGLNFEDSYFDANWPAIRAAGLVRGAYQYFEPAQDAAAQADMVVRKVGRLASGDLPVQLDMEATGGQSPATIVNQMNIWIERVSAGTGKRPMIYSARYFWNDNVGSTAFSDDALWVANYGVVCPNLPDAWTDWLIWQYGDDGRVPGIDGAVDTDRFNGTVEDLRHFAGLTPAYAAEYVSQSFPLARDGMTMTAGESSPAYIELRNVGTATWNADTRLAASNPRDRESAFAASDWLSPSRLAAVSGSVPPGESYRFAFTLQAPLAPGTYAEFFSVVQEGVAWFSDPGQGGPPDDQLQDKITVLPSPMADAGASDAGAGSVEGDGSSGVADAGASPGEDAATFDRPDGAAADSDASDGDAAAATASDDDSDGGGCRSVRRRSNADGTSFVMAIAAIALLRRRLRVLP